MSGCQHGAAFYQERCTECKLKDSEARCAELEKRAAWAESMLERAKEAFTDVAVRIAKREPQDLVGHVMWLADYAKGPSEGNGGGGK